MNRSPPPGGYQSFSRGLPCGSSLEVVALGRAITLFRVTAKSDPPACHPEGGRPTIHPEGRPAWVGTAFEGLLSGIAPKAVSFRGDSEESRSRDRLTDRASPKIRSTQKNLSQKRRSPSRSYYFVFTGYSPVVNKLKKRKRKLVGARGLEPRTNGLKGHCSTN